LISVEADFMDDKSLGSLIVVFSLLFMVGYLVWAFGPLIPIFRVWITPELSEWAYRLPVFLAVNAMLLLVIWIGYTMATTPPPIPLENPLEIVREEYDSVGNNSEEEEN
jgi:predicted DNA-binding transcriptional regulator